MLSCFKYLLTIIIAVLLYTDIAFAQSDYTVSGFIKEEESGENLIGANVYIKELLQGTTTNQYGFFSITVPEGQYHLVISYLGFTDIEEEIDLTKNIRYNKSLSSSAITTQEVVIEGERSDKNIESTQMGKLDLEVEQIKSLPAFMGEVDVLKAIQLLPGIQSAGEGNSGFYVRGGGPDQNLVLLDEAVVYNVSHLFGFFSVFNADAIKNVEVIKGGMPANYGGRLASVLDITMKDGNRKSFEVDGGIGLISSRLTVQGPIKKNVSSFIVSGRRTYIDILLKPFTKNSKVTIPGYFFYDLTAKINYDLSDNDKLYLSAYFGRDVFNFGLGGDDQGGFNVKIPWGNATSSLRWNHLINEKMFVNTSLIFSDYDFSFGITQNEFELILFSGVRDFNTKVDFNYFPNVRHNIKFGLNHIYHIFTPSSTSASQGDVVFNTGEIIKQYGHESALYFNDEWSWTELLKLNAGLRVSMFNHVGPFTRYTKDEVGTIEGEIKYNTGDLIKTYGGLEPRLSLRYALNNKSSIKAAYTHNYQYIHLASMASISLPTDVWVGASDQVEPLIGTQYAMGYFRNLFDNKYETSVELYYKDMANLIEYEDGFTPSDNVQDNADSHFTTGKGTSYGAEFFIKKRAGDLTGWIGYTLSKTTRVFEEINGGDPFPAKYDRTHDLSVVGTYDLQKKDALLVPDSLKIFGETLGRLGNWFRVRHWTFGATFVYATGNSITLPIGRYMIEGNIVNEYGPRNWYRMVPYHRMDLSITLKGKEDKRFRSSWNLSVYNAYSRANPYFIYFDTDIDVVAGTLETKAVQVSLFPILPSLTWNFSF